ncbi:uncharacterized protein F5891DRAFT_1188356 [Suillus fuscotomentosus]|uniref:Uncharacterized protein n=1 Tax=Suillus fuscotomentosus TaxID=1912939 RepID=A0AAD4E9F4_9AGAM|nr:uncharacterized protein F5891DRAFT_1188356 [Suillus fuscotomentosus]KAG1900859.1 hypothetical protein F5891DRAFT_1188356 [Suillus fuscotomentosus]
MYEVDLGQDDEDDNSEAETAKTEKHRGRSKKLNDNRRTKGTIVEEPDIVLSIREWSEYDVEHLESQSPSMYSIPLVIDMNGEVLHELWDSVKFFKDFFLPDQADIESINGLCHHYLVFPLRIWSFPISFKYRNGLSPL